MAFLTIAVLVLLSMLLEKNMNLKEEMKKNYDLVNENYNLKKKNDGLKEDNKFLKEVVMEFKAGELTKGELVKSVQSLIDNEESEILKRLKKITQGEKEL